MKKTVLSSVLAAIFTLLIFTSPAAADFKKTKIAVLDFQLQGSGYETTDMGKIVAEWLITALVKEGRFDVIERRLLEKVLSEQKLGASGFIDESTAAKLGSVLGARIIITGSVMKFQNVMEVNARIIEVESSSIIAAESVKSTSAIKLEDLVVQMAEKIIKDFPLEGYIVQREEKKVIVDLGRRAGVKPGMQFVVYKEGKVIKHPKTGEVLDIERIETGCVEINSISDKTADGIIVKETAANSVQYGQLVKSKSEIIPLEGYIKPQAPGEKVIPSGEHDELYKKALLLRDEGDYDSAYDIIKKLASESPGNNNYQISYIDISLDQAAAMKEAKNPGWPGKIRETGEKIKALRATNTTNADYYLVFAKYSWIAESKKETNITKALEKAFYYKPNYSNALIVKGDIYYGLAKNTSTLESSEPDSTSLTGGSPTYSRQSLAAIAKSSYELALTITDLDNRKKCYVYYKLGELEYHILNNKTNAKENWEKAVSINPDSRTGKLAKERLNK